MSKMAGKQSVLFPKGVAILSAASCAGQKEGEGPLGEEIDRIVEDPMFGKDTWEQSESTFLKEACQVVLKKGGKKPEDIRMAFSGDLLGQLIASSYGMAELGIPFYGVYSACASIGSALSLGAMAVDGKYAEYVIAASSSHFASAEKEFRFPLGYGTQRPYCATWTTTGAGAFLLGSVTKNKEERDLSGQMESSHKEDKPQSRKTGKNSYETDNTVYIKGITTGKIKDYGVKDPFNMGACMAPAAADTIYQALHDFHKTVDDFDQIITGDLGTVGRKICLELLEENQIFLGEKHMDCGMQIFNEEEQDTHAGGSGPGCSAIVLASMILPKMKRGEWKNVLFVPTGALLSQITANESRTIPAIAHGLWLSIEGGAS